MIKFYAILIAAAVIVTAILVAIVFNADSWKRGMKHAIH